VGGFGKFGKGATAVKHFDLPPHRKLRIMTEVWKIDSWDNEEFYIKADIEKVYSIKMGFADKGLTNVCGQAHNNWNERQLNIDVSFDHKAD
jgi:hypothetical protein